jgi:hypothetical protein
MKLLNANPQNSDIVTYDIQVMIDGVPLKPEQYNPHTWQGNPTYNSFRVALLAKKKETKKDNVISMAKANKVARRAGRDDDMDDELDYLIGDKNRIIEIHPDAHLVKVDPIDKSFNYKNGNVTAILKKQQHYDEYYYSRVF